MTRRALDLTLAAHRHGLLRPLPPRITALGATGARITGKAAALLHRTGGRYALATQCIGGGQGIATVLEAVA